MDTNRFLMELDRARRVINREVIAERLPELKLEQLTPMLRMVAHARADYVETFLAVADNASDGVPTTEQLARLKAKRLAFDELVAAANALETVVQREYLEIDLER